MAPSQIPSLFIVKMKEGIITLKEVEKRLVTTSGTILDASSDLKGEK